MSYTVLARRYRSQSFGQVIGQEPIAKTLRNAIKADRVHHAYLFTGTRGVGKTSMARIFARALNAPDTIDDCPKSDYDFPPQDVQQRMAEAIMRGDDLNVIEIDGASNRGVDDARQLIANAGLAPTANARYKIYIIDEVHMLTREAFNTLLKTLEEPPSHLKWIFCTTEAEKVLPTIQSRCQRFDFRHIPTAIIDQHLKTLLEKEEVKAEEGVTYELAKLGDGSMRDALSVTDRLLATGENPLTLALLEQMLGLPDRQLLSKLVDAFIQSDVATALNCTNDLLTKGISQDQFLVALIEYLRQLMLINACGVDSDLVELDETLRKQLAAQAQKFDTPAIIHMIALCEALQRNSKLSSSSRAMLDAAMARLAMSEHFINIATLAAGGGNLGNAEAKKKDEIGTGVNYQTTPQKITTQPQSTPTPQATTSTPQKTQNQSQQPITDDQLWPAAIESAEKLPSLSWIHDLELVSIANNLVTVRIKPQSRSKTNFLNMQQSSLEELLRTLTGRPVKIAMQAAVVGDSATPQSTETQPTQIRRFSQDEKDQAMRMPLVREVIDMFDATLISLKDRKK